jgi:predicted phosphohydrolase
VEKDIKTLEMLHNNCVFYGDYALCGTRGWFLEEDQKPHNAKVLAREVGRLEMSLQAAGEKPILCFLHYPPLYQGYECLEILEILKKYDVRQCCYGHLHGPTIRRRLEGKRGDIEYSLISADYLGFIPKKICE